ncbi:hypothetical protein E3N88_22095 [Mikania micrantha]|uniref:BTB domain-containing protein n=1 Tax=Mikania micrantha TaxID=192012 RepID=A0A5N6N9S6_9ASTR|nr:hypothetical protein E3N88_22095 [Mikania micrantha]
MNMLYFLAENELHFMAHIKVKWQTTFSLQQTSCMDLLRGFSGPFEVGVDHTTVMQENDHCESDGFVERVLFDEFSQPETTPPSIENCGCQLRSCYGLPCAHELAMYVYSEFSIPLTCIDPFWTKLDLLPSIKVEYDDIMERACIETLETSSSSLSPPAATTTSTSVTETVNGEHDFRISGYALSKGIGIGKYVASDTFMVGGYTWAIYFYPDGKSVEDNATYVSLFIALASEGSDVRALFELTLLDQSGRERHKVHSHFGRSLESGPYTLKYKGSMWGYKRFFKRTSLEASSYLKDDCLQIHCCVGVVGSRMEGPKTYSIHVPPSDLGQHFGQLLECGKGTDVSFEVKGETFLAHKLVLAARSPVFRARLFGPMRDQISHNIKVEDIEPPVFKTDGFDYLKESCPSVMTELLECVARISEHGHTIRKRATEVILDGVDVHGRRLFFSYFKDLVGREVTVELKNDLAIRGTLHSVDQYLNIKLENTRVVDQEKYPHMLSVRNCFIRGSVVRYVQLPPDGVDIELLHDATRREARGG